MAWRADVQGQEGAGPDRAGCWLAAAARPREPDSHVVLVVGEVVQADVLAGAAEAEAGSDGYGALTDAPRRTPSGQVSGQFYAAPFPFSFPSRDNGV